MSDLPRLWPWPFYKTYNWLHKTSFIGFVRELVTWRTQFRTPHDQRSYKPGRERTPNIEEKASAIFKCDAKAE